MTGTVGQPSSVQLVKVGLSDVKTIAEISTLHETAMAFAEQALRP
jgi:hypothetical protein